MNRIVAILALLVGLAVVGSTMLFVVDQRQYALVLSLGEIRRVITEPGLHFKLPPPFQNVVYFDNRVLTLDTPDTDRARTSENVELLVDSFVKWRVEDPIQFFRTFGERGENAARDRMTDLLRDAIQNAFRRRTVNEVTSKERDRVRQEITDAVAGGAARQNFGIDVLDVRLKRIEFSPSVLPNVFGRMESERKRVANERRSTGQAEGERIRADAERQREVIVAEAYRDAQKIKGEGDGRAAAIFSQAFGQNPEFADFYRGLEALRASIRKGDVLVVDPAASDFFRHMRSPNASGKPAR
ncbi:MAG: protease modulator HflC [Betaproteobacteria bacterium]